MFSTYLTTNFKKLAAENFTQAQETTKLVTLKRKLTAVLIFFSNANWIVL
jgi:hypothetical protein